jgi:hypothetical protein
MTLLQVILCTRVSRIQEKHAFSVLEYAFTVMSLYRAGSFTTAVRELARYKLHLVGVLDFRWDKGGTVRTGDYICFYGKGKENHQLGTGFFVYHGILSASLRTIEENTAASVFASKEVV